MKATTSQKKAAEKWFKTLRDRITLAFENVEMAYGETQSDDTPPGKFSITPWSRPGGGGGEMGLMRGQVFEKVGVNISTVHGAFDEKFAGTIPGTEQDPSFWASGISLVAHMKNPYVPAVHMNTRLIVTSKSWVGGGTDLTPTFAFAEDTDLFHHHLKAACDATDPSYYARFKAWCDEYFYLPHRGETRGVGGIFYDYVNSGCWNSDFQFTQNVGTAFLTAYLEIVKKRMHHPWTPQDRQKLREKRGRYVEFNLLYDRGTLFGLKTNGNVDAILMSLPPDVSWP
jgi:coproporphyrinogen III oxidase